VRSGGLGRETADCWYSDATKSCHCSCFPEDFFFQLSEREKAEVITNCDHLQNLKFSKALPHAFTEHGALMAANVLNSAGAVKMSVFIIRAFIEQREALSANAIILKRLAEIDKRLLLHDSALRDLYQKLLPLLQPPPDKPLPRIGFGKQDDRLRSKHPPA
jgi:ORF6N domain-containing protein